MRLMSFLRDGREGYGALDGDTVTDLSGALPHSDLASLIGAGALNAAAAAMRAGAPRLPLSSLTFLGPLPRARLFCVGANYPKPHPLGGHVSGPEHISYFIKHQAALVPHRHAVSPPGVSVQFDYEGELAVVIGRSGRGIAEADALSHVFGYTILNDGSVRDWQKHSVAAGKNFYRSGSWGPWITTADEVGDPAALRLTTRLNGRTVQDSRIDAMFFSVPAIIAYLSTISPLEPGDVIATGSPEGTGATQSPPRFLRSGDVMEFEIERLGILANTVA